MRVAVFPSDRGGCGWYRLLHPARVLADQGHDVEVDDGERKGQHRLRHPDGTDTLTHVDIDADVAVFQRVVRAEVVEVIAQAKAQGVRVVVDVDDDLDSLHPRHPYRDEVGGNEPGKSSGNLHAACQLADVVTVTTGPLAERYGYGKAVVLPNLVPERWLRFRRVKSRRVAEPLLVGWTGRPQSHIDDALVMGGRVGPIVAGAGARFAAFGQTAPITFRQVGVPPQAQRRMPFKELTAGYPQMVGKLDVGLAPLQDSEFCRAKSWLKMAEYAALGVPCIGSDLPEYRKLHRMGVGLVAGSAGEWADHVHRLLASPSERADLAESGRAVMAGLTYEAHSHRWWNAWTGDLSADHARWATLMEAEGDTPAPAPV